MTTIIGLVLLSALTSAGAAILTLTTRSLIAQARVNVVRSASDESSGSSTSHRASQQLAAAARRGALPLDDRDRLAAFAECCGRCRGSFIGYGNVGRLVCRGALWNRRNRRIHRRPDGQWQRASSGGHRRWGALALLPAWSTSPIWSPRDRGFGRGRPQDRYGRRSPVLHRGWDPQRDAWRPGQHADRRLPCRRIKGSPIS